MSDPVVLFDHVWKKFRRGERHDSLRDLVPSIARRLISRPVLSDLNGENEFWVLKDVSFEVRPGEALGIIGPNGAGKSTVLKLLTRILRPTRGRAAVKGRIGALIEVAAGFHPDLTGRENIYLQGSIMGMKRAEITTKLDEIIDFAGVGSFIDTQVKRYSTGMNARLGFSIAAHLDPDVLVIDEVLSVGDMEFQKRCVARMIDFKRRGVTIVFVSHDLHAVSRLCDRALLLNRAVGLIDDTQKVLEEYVKSATVGEASSSDEITIVGAVLSDNSGRPVSAVSPGDTLRLRVTYQAKKSISDLHLGFLVHRSTDNLVVYDQSFGQASLGLATFSAGDVVTIDYSFDVNLTRGQYHLELHVLHTPTFMFLARLRPAGTFSVSESHSFTGVAFLNVRPSAIPNSARERLAITS